MSLARWRPSKGLYAVVALAALASLGVSVVLGAGLSAWRGTPAQRAIGIVPDRPLRSGPGVVTVPAPPLHPQSPHPSGPAVAAPAAITPSSVVHQSSARPHTPAKKVHKPRRPTQPATPPVPVPPVPVPPVPVPPVPVPPVPVQLPPVVPPVTIPVTVPVLGDPPTEHAPEPVDRPWKSGDDSAKAAKAAEKLAKKADKAAEEQAKQADKAADEQAEVVVKAAAKQTQPRTPAAPVPPAPPAPESLPPLPQSATGTEAPSASAEDEVADAPHEHGNCSAPRD